MACVNQPIQYKVKHLINESHAFNRIIDENKGVTAYCYQCEGKYYYAKMGTGPFWIFDFNQILWCYHHSDQMTLILGGMRWVICPDVEISQNIFDRTKFCLFQKKKKKTSASIHAQKAQNIPIIVRISSPLGVHLALIWHFGVCIKYATHFTVVFILSPNICSSFSH